jgi:hypothetical protein
MSLTISEHKSKVNVLTSRKTLWKYFYVEILVQLEIVQ